VEPRGRRRSTVRSLKVLAWVAVARVIGASLRLRHVGDDPFRDDSVVILAIWHGVLPVVIPTFRDRRLVAAVSTSRGGHRLEAILTRLGYARSARGSTTKQPLRLLSGMIRAIRAGSRVALTCDGGSGPEGRVKPGVVMLARATGVPIRPLGIGVRHGLRFRSSWETVVVALPFSRVVCCWGKPVYVARECSRDDLEKARLQVEEELHRATLEAQALAAK